MRVYTEFRDQSFYGGSLADVLTINADRAGTLESLGFAEVRFTITPMTKTQSGEVTDWSVEVRADMLELE